MDKLRFLFSILLVFLIANLSTALAEDSALVDIAQPYGIATQGTNSTYSYYSPPSNAIDGDDSSYNHTSGDASENWWQLELPNPTLISKIMIQGRNSNTGRLNGATVYFTETPYNGVLDENNKVATLAGNGLEQITEFPTAKSARYLIVKASSTNNLHLATVEVFGTLPPAPVLTKTDYNLGLAVNAAINSVVAKVKALDYQDDDLTYSITGNVPFAIDNNGVITLTEIVNHNVTQHYNFTVTASDGTESDTSNVTVKLLNGTGVHLERWTGISGGYVSNLTDSTHFQNDPADVIKNIAQLDDYEATVGGNHYGQRLTTLLKPTESGHYIFNLVADKRAELWLSGSDDTSNLEKITATTWHSASHKAWDDSHAKQSTRIYLQAGAIYAIQVLHKDGGDPNFVAVGWKKVDDVAYTLIPANQLYLGVLDTQTVKPVFDQQETLFFVDHIPNNGELLTTSSATDTQGDTLSYSLSGAESALFVIDSTGKITANGDVKLASYTFDVQVSDGTHTVTKTITILVSVNIAQQFGVATQSSNSSYYYYRDPANAIDGDMNTFNMTADNGWWQVALPKGSKVAKVVIYNRTDGATYRLNGTKVYLGKTSFDGTIIESDYIATLTGSTAPQIVTFDDFKEGDYILLKEDNDNLHVLEVEVYGITSETPVIASGQRDFLLPLNIPDGSAITTLSGVDYQYDPISYSIDGVVPFAIDNQGNITVNGSLTSEAVYTFDAVISDGENTSRTTFTIQATSATAIDDAIASGLTTTVTETELIQATLDEIEASKSFLRDAKIQIFNLDADGTAKADDTSLTEIDWTPTWDASTFTSIVGENTMLLESNAVDAEGLTIYNKEMAVIGEKGNGRYILMASNPMRTGKNADMQQVIENSLTWLTKRDNLKTAPFSVVLAHLDNSYYFRDETKTREWLDANYTGQVSYNAENACDGTALEGCLNASPDLLIISQISTTSDDVEAIAATVKAAQSNGTAVLYIHHDGNLKALGRELLSSVFKVSYEWDNRNKRLKLENYNPVETLNVITQNNQKIKTLFTHFKETDYNFDWSVCKDSNGAMGENYDKCGDVVGLNSEFQAGASIIRTMVNGFDNAQINIFNENAYRLQKLLILTADKFRQSIAYPMDKVTTDDNEFMRSYYADHAIYNYRKINPAQANMGNFSRSDFSHITPMTKTVNLTSKKSFRSTGAYALPGQTVKVTRNDSSDLTVNVFINTLRSGATHHYQQKGYKRPKYLKTPYFEIKTGETIELTSPYGGTLQLSFNKNDLPVAVTFENVGEHPYWASATDNASFTQKLAASEYDWAEVATAGFEVHSKLDKMKTSVADAKWGGTAEGLANAVEKYTSNYPHVLAGFKGNGVDIVPEIHDWANDKGITIETIDTMKHMNADQATCGYGCSGNPYDAYWSFDPIGHGDIHEMGHSMQKKRFEGFPNHAATNTFSYYTKSRYFDITGGEPSCQGIPFKTLFETIQASVGQSDRVAYLKTNLWDGAGLGEQYLLKIQAMMHAEKMGKVENGWHVLARVHILEREKNRAKQDWDARKTSIGFSTYSLSEFNSIRDNDWLIVSYSYAAGLDYRNYFDMMGIPYSQKARNQIASFNYDVVPDALFVSTNTGYCKQDGAGRLFDRPTIAIDGTQTWPAETDTDSDGHWDAYDNCPLVANADQLDSDSNGIGDLCQDTDSDTIVDALDNCPLVANTDQQNSDSNGIGDLCQDTDNDTIIDALDNCPADANTDQLNTDNDTQGNVCDADNDGLPDQWETDSGLDPLVNDASLDNDNDGLSNLQEFQVGTDPKNADTDGDGIDDKTEIDLGTDPTKPNSTSGVNIIPILNLLLDE
jgi:hypothetical protein